MREDILSADFYEPLRVIWKWLRRESVLSEADCIVGFGNYNCDIAIRAAELYHKGLSNKVLFSGGLGRNTLGIQQITEADRFAATALREGVPAEDILIENRSTNSAENILFTKELLAQNGIFPKKLICVHQPFMERRVAAAFDVTWSEVELLTTSLPIDIPDFFAHAVTNGVTEKMVVEEVVGDFQRMKLYADKGWQSPQEIPADVWRAFETLVALGYDGQLAK